MAKTTAKTSPEVDSTDVATVVEKDLTAKTKGLIEAVKTTFIGYVADYGALSVRAGKLASPFMKAANAWMAETGKSFVHFVRVIDPSVPQEQKGYRDHPSFNRAMYLKGLIDRPKATKAAEELVGGARPIAPFDAFASLIAAIQPLVPEEQIDKLWEVIKSELHWSEPQVTRLENKVKEAEPLIGVRAPRGGQRPVLRIVQPRHISAEAA